MGYVIEYSPQDKRRYPTTAQKTKRKKYAHWLLILVILICFLIPGVRSRAVNILIPGDDEVTKAAFQTMVERLQLGEPVNDTVTAFCQEILNNGKF